jgi:hypothetical protein
MKTMVTPLVFAALLVAGSQAFADDSMSSQSLASHKQMMQECVTKEKSTNTTLSTDDAKKMCKEKVKGETQKTLSGAPKDGQTDPK